MKDERMKTNSGLAWMSRILKLMRIGASSGIIVAKGESRVEA